MLNKLQIFTLRKHKSNFSYLYSKEEKICFLPVLLKNKAISIDSPRILLNSIITILNGLFENLENSGGRIA